MKLPEPQPGWAGGAKELIQAARTATGARATQIALAVLLGAYEDGTSRDSWRNPTSDNRTYFTALRDWGYPLSEVEHLVLDPDTDQGPNRTDDSPEDRADEPGTDRNVHEDDDTNPEPDDEVGDEAGAPAEQAGWPATA